jgi:hypothetical protein
VLSTKLRLFVLLSQTFPALWNFVLLLSLGLYFGKMQAESVILVASKLNCTTKEPMEFFKLISNITQNHSSPKLCVCRTFIS